MKPDKDADAKALDPYRPILARHDPAVLATLEKIPQAMTASGRSLDAKTRELVTIVMLTTLRGDPAAIRHHVREAVAQGASKQEILEAIELVITPAGMPVFEHGLMAWADALGEEGLEVEARFSKLPTK